MQYFHRTSLAPDDVLAEADQFFGSQLETVDRTDRSRSYKGSVGAVHVDVKAEGGHYTHVKVRTDQVGESEADNMVKRFLGSVHKRVEPAHQLRGAY
jgi:hypothetical protein